jgi:hypothetical protein
MAAYFLSCFTHPGFFLSFSARTDGRRKKSRRKEEKGESYARILRPRPLLGGAAGERANRDDRETNKGAQRSLRGHCLVGATHQLLLPHDMPLQRPIDLKNGRRLQTKCTTPRVRIPAYLEHLGQMKRHQLKLTPASWRRNCSSASLTKGYQDVFCHCALFNSQLSCCFSTQQELCFESAWSIPWQIERIHQSRGFSVEAGSVLSPFKISRVQ